MTWNVISDSQLLSQPMGQFGVWYDKLFWFSGETLGWRYIKGLPRKGLI